MAEERLQFQCVLTVSSTDDEATRASMFDKILTEYETLVTNQLSNLAGTIINSHQIVWEYDKLGPRETADKATHAVVQTADYWLESKNTWEEVQAEGYKIASSCKTKVRDELGKMSSNTRLVRWIFFDTVEINEKEPDPRGR